VVIDAMTESYEAAAVNSNNAAWAFWEGGGGGGEGAGADGLARGRGMRLGRPPTASKMTQTCYDPRPPAERRAGEARGVEQAQSTRRAEAGRERGSGSLKREAKHLM